MDAQLTPTHQQFTKFSPITVATKENMRNLRKNAGYSMNQGAELFGISRKQLEDIETLRNYGSHIDLEILTKASVVYKTSINKIVGNLPTDTNSKYFERPRKRLGSASRQ